jgi:probable phosphoglycerate mutase
MLRDQPVAAVYVSDLRRAMQTAAPLAAVLGLPITTDARLRERNLGVLEGAPITEAGPAVTGIADAGDGSQSVTDPDARPEGGESLRDFYLRAAAFAGELAGRAACERAGRAAGELAGRAVPPGDIVVVAHGGTLRVLHACLNGLPVEHMPWMPVPNGTVLRYSARRKHP